MKQLQILILLMTSFFISSSWADHLEQPNVTYQKKPSGRVYGSDGSVTDPMPSFPNKVYDSDGRAYFPKEHTLPNGSEGIAQPLPRAITPVGKSTGVRAGVGGVRR